jgi:3-hydroxyisobutyrate dehydrogenase-like beta-hydroxyacid dehydrogenase
MKRGRAKGYTRGFLADERSFGKEAGNHMDVGFIGLGSMGQAMATNLLKAGHTVRVWNRSPAPVEALVALGAQAAVTAREAFSGDAVISMFADDAAVRAVILDGGLLDHAPRGLVHVNMATLSVQIAQELLAAHVAHGIAYVAAPVFGRPEAAAAAKLHIAAAGDAAAIDRVQPLFDVMGQKTWRFGEDAPRANAVKLAGNFMIASVIESLAESTAMAEGYGVEPEALIQLLTGTLFNAPVYHTYGALVVNQRFDPAGFKLRLGLKDVRLVLAAAEAVHTPMPFASVIRDGLREGSAHGDGERDWSALSLVTRRRAGLEREA